MFSIYQKIRDPHSIEMTDNCMVNVIPIGEELIAATETDFVHQFDRKTLESTKRVGIVICSALMINFCIVIMIDKLVL